MTAAILYQEAMKEYDFGSGHPFHGDRYKAFISFLQRRLPADSHYRILAVDPATDEDLLRICDQDYIDFCREYYHAAAGGWIGYYENYSRYQSVDNKPIGTPGEVEQAARLIVGQAKAACDIVAGGQYPKAISVGGGMHHAKRRFGEGFCIYNDVAFSALYLIEKYHFDRVLVLDTDAHAGNGTAEYIRSNPNVLFIDIHQDPQTIYPGTGFAPEIGADSALGYTVNIPMPVHSGNASYMLAFDSVILPLTREFRPQIIIRNGGSDPHYNDGLTYLGVTLEGLRAIGEKVREMAEVCEGKEVDLIASGYNPRVLPEAWMALVSGVANFPVTIDETGPIPTQFETDAVLPETEKVLDEVKKYHRNYWKCFQ